MAAEPWSLEARKGWGESYHPWPSPRQARRHNVASRTLSECQEAANEIAASRTGRQALGFAADVSKSSEIEKLREDVESSLGTVDILSTMPESIFAGRRGVV
jgi:hypothetical protein